jgi:hypothetical protein
MIRAAYRVAMPRGESTPTSPRPDPEPFEVDERPFVVVGIALWVVAFVVLAVFFRADLRAHHTEWWLWSCGVGVLLGAYGLRFVSRRRRR